MAASGRLPSVAREVLSYGVIGVLSASTDAIIFWSLTTRFALDPQLANAAGVVCGITLSFWLNRAFTFRVRDRALARFATFWAVGLGGLALSALILQTGLSLGLPAMRVKLVSILIVASVQFALNRTITFRRGPDRS
ncbi:MAG: hypothetical protein CVT66_04450 [Actinobacteria bacterium HGW-Actinobacteria-6]|nr:MAG: hypothetical protein CVT66_04450 [Actinobacteria bacterium HGW-Actinobacteria-6]